MNHDKKVSSIAVIPARYASTRLPGKMLLEINGKPIIQHVWENVSKSKELDNFFVATDDERISEKCRSFGANCVLTPPELPSQSRS